jgi:positive regulator of sigma E activity
MENIRILNAKMFQSLVLITVVPLATLLLFAPFYVSKSLQIEVPKSIFYIVIFVYGYLVIKIINSFFQSETSNLNNLSEKGNDNYTDQMYEELEK